MEKSINIKVVGVGGSGSNTISRMAKCDLQSVNLIAINTDAQALRSCRAKTKILIGEQTTKGLGTGMDISLGIRAAKENRGKIEEILKGLDMLFITCGLGGGTGSGATPIVAAIAKNLGILTVAIVTMPFSFEGAQRKKIADRALKRLKGKTDALLAIPNDRLLQLVGEKTTVLNAFWICDEVLKEAVQGITDLILGPGIINVDFPAVKTIIMENPGRAVFGIGRAKGENRAVRAALSAINSSLFDFPIEKAKGILFNVSGQGLTLSEISEAAKIITKNADPKAQIIFGAREDKKIKSGEIKITLIAIGL